MKDQQLQEITNKYGKAIDREIRKDSKGKRGNIAIVTFSTKDSTEKDITGINETNKYITKKYEYEANSEVLSIQETNQEQKKNRTSKPKATPSRMLCLWVK